MKGGKDRGEQQAAVMLAGLIPPRPSLHLNVGPQERLCCSDDDDGNRDGIRGCIVNLIWREGKGGNKSSSSSRDRAALHGLAFVCQIKQNDGSDNVLSVSLSLS